MPMVLQWISMKDLDHTGRKALSSRYMIPQSQLAPRPLGVPQGFHAMTCEKAMMQTIDTGTVNRRRLKGKCQLRLAESMMQIYIPTLTPERKSLYKSEERKRLDI